MRVIKRTEEEIDEVLNLASNFVEHGRTSWDGLTYEEGVEAALLWLFGESADNPMIDK
jgi:hypothetical protein